MGAEPGEANEVAQQVERRVYEGITTKAILQLIFTYMRKYNPAVGHLVDLRRGISIMDPKPEFEMFVRVLLSNSGFEVTPNQVLRGQCGEHEVDAIAKKDGVTYFVEVKHHFSYHALTGLDESRIAWAILEDVGDALKLGLTHQKIDQAMIITNTRYSEHAVKYGLCKGIVQVGWSSPQFLGLKEMVEASKLYPISCLKGLRYEVRMRLVDAGIVLIKQLLQQDKEDIINRTGLPQTIVFSTMEKAQHSASSIWEL
jgi:hypothetical protein